MFRGEYLLQRCRGWRQPGSYELMPGFFNAVRSWPLRPEIYVDRATSSVRLIGDHRRKGRAEYEAENQFVEGGMK
jgi:hypothetical protein